jgi:hypothetical protein
MPKWCSYFLFLALLLGCLKPVLGEYPTPPYYTVTIANEGVDRLRAVGPHTEVKILSKGRVLEIQDYLTTGPKSYSEVKAYGITLRQGSSSITQWIEKHHWKIHEGSLMVCLEDKMTFTISSSRGRADISGPCTFIAEATSNGGYKFITLSGNPYIKTKEKKLRMPAGRLVLVLGEQESLGNAYDVDIMLLLQSSLLFNAFEEPPPTMKKIGLAIFAQQKRMKGKYNALIGDATSDKNLQMWVLGNQDSSN